MKLSKREIVLIVILIIVAGSAAYYFFWLAPRMAKISELTGKIEQTKQDIEESNLRIVQFELLSDIKRENAEQWDALLESIPQDFDEAEVLRQIERHFDQYTSDVTVEFPELTSPLERTEVFSVIIKFSVTYDALLQILEDFEEDDTQLRIVNLDYEVMSIVEDRQILSVVLSAEYLALNN